MISENLLPFIWLQWCSTMLIPKKKEEKRAWAASRNSGVVLSLPKQTRLPLPACSVMPQSILPQSCHRFRLEKHALNYIRRASPPFAWVSSYASAHSKHDGIHLGRRARPLQGREQEPKPKGHHHSVGHLHCLWPLRLLGFLRRRDPFNTYISDNHHAGMTG